MFESSGGASAVAAAVEDLYLRTLADPKLAAHFAHAAVAGIKEHQRAFLTRLLGGLDDLSRYSLRETHAGLGITHADFNRIVQHLIDTLIHMRVDAPVTERIIAAVGSLRAEVVER